MQTQLLVLSNMSTKIDNFDIISKRLKELYDEMFSIDKEERNIKEDIELGLQFLKK